MKTLTVNVTQEHVDKACRKNAHLCMIAFAIMEQNPLARHVVVDTQAVKFSIEGTRYQYFTPPTAAQAIVDFDNGRPVRPFSIQLSNGIERPAGQNVPRKNPRNKGMKRTYKRNAPTVFREFGRRKFNKIVVGQPQQT